MEHLRGQKVTKLFLFVLSVFVILLVTVASFLQSRQLSQYQSQPATTFATSVSHSESSDSNSEYRTVEAHTTAIAVFTANPSLALSSTPYFIEIILDDLSTRDHDPTRISYIRTTMPKCYPAIVNKSLGDLSQEPHNTYAKAEIDANVDVVSVGVEGYDTVCEAPFRVSQTLFRIYVSDNTLAGTQEFYRLFSKIISILADYWRNQNNEFVSTTSTILNLYVDGADSYLNYQERIETVIEAFETGLHDDKLADYLGSPQIFNK